MATSPGGPAITDVTLHRINEGVQLHHFGGRPGQARAVFSRIWAEIGGEGGDPLHVCVLAHAMADVQDDVRSELWWDERALAAAGLLTAERVAAAGVALPLAGLYPSLHLNLADCHRRLGDVQRAREHVALARERMGALSDDGYGRLIRDGLQRLEGLLIGDDSEGPASERR